MTTGILGSLSRLHALESDLQNNANDKLLLRSSTSPIGEVTIPSTVPSVFHAGPGPSGSPYILACPKIILIHKLRKNRLIAKQLYLSHSIC